MEREPVVTFQKVCIGILERRHTSVHALGNAYEDRCGCNHTVNGIIFPVDPGGEQTSNDNAPKKNAQCAPVGPHWRILGFHSSVFCVCVLYTFSECLLIFATCKFQGTYKSGVLVFYFMVIATWFVYFCVESMYSSLSVTMPVCRAKSLDIKSKHKDEHRHPALPLQASAGSLVV